MTEKEYTAYVNVFDKDYNCFAYEEKIQVDSIEEARSYCKENNWSGERYVLYLVLKNKNREVVNHEPRSKT